MNVGSNKWNKFDISWVINLFGTAVGAGILFLPINAGMGGIWPLIVMVIVVGPMTYLSHRGLSRFVLSSSKPGSDITEVVEEHFGNTAGKLITLLYFFAIFPILLIYGNGITNTVNSFMVHQLGLEEPNRALLSFVLIASLISVMLVNEKFMLKITEILVYPLITILFFLSLYLIPQWKADIFTTIPNAKDFLLTLWVTIPVLVFSFNHSPAISAFSQSQQKKYIEFDLTERHASKTLKGTACILLIFVMLFVFSCVLTLTPEELAEAKQQNIPILSYFANKFNNPFISYLGPFIAFLAITSSFFGHYLGAREGLEGLYLKLTHNTQIDRKKLQKYSAIFFMVTLWVVAIINPSILGLIETLGGPIIAMILFIMPMYAIYKVPAMSRYKNQFLSNIFVVVMGFVAISALLYSIFRIFVK